MNFDLTDLRLFVNIADTHSLTRGAERSHLSLPAASVRVKNVEDSSGCKLLNRGNQGVTLTPPGQVLVHHARLILMQLNQLSWEIQDYSKGIKGHVRLLANTSAISEFLPAVLSRFLASYPDVNVELEERLSPDIVRAVAEGTTDIGIVAGHVRTEGLQVLPYRTDRLVLVTSASHDLAQNRQLDFSDTLDHDYVGLQEPSAIHSFLNQAANHAGKLLKMRIQVGNFEALCRMIEAGVGIGIVPESAARRHAQVMNICLVPLLDEWSQRNLKICVRNVDLLPAFAQVLIDLLVKDGK